MLTLYYSKGASSLAAHILLEEVGAPYQAVDVPLATDAQRQPGFLDLNPKGRVPTLGTPDGIVTENPAILEYIAATHPKAGLLPDTPFVQAQARSLSAYLCATVHVAFAHDRRADRWADDAAAQADMRAKVASNIAACAAHLNTSLALSPWALGSAYSYVDPYLFLMARWLEKTDQQVGDYPALAAHSAALRARPATQRAFAANGTTL